MQQLFYKLNWPKKTIHQIEVNIFLVVGCMHDVSLFPNNYFLKNVTSINFLMLAETTSDKYRLVHKQCIVNNHTNILFLFVFRATFMEAARLSLWLKLTSSLFLVSF